MDLAHALPPVNVGGSCFAQESQHGRISRQHFGDKLGDPGLERDRPQPPHQPPSDSLVLGGVLDHKRHLGAGWARAAVACHADDTPPRTGGGQQALPLAQQLASEWGASLWLAQVVRPATAVSALSGPYAVAAPFDPEPPIGEAHQYLEQVASALTGEVHTDVFNGAADRELAIAARDWGITDIVMASHGRTGLSRVVLGSAADSLVHRLHCPIIVVPALVVGAMQRRQAALTAGEPGVPV